MTLDEIATKFHVRTMRDECGDEIISGTRGHLYLDDGALCLMALDARVLGMNDEQLRGLGGNFWAGALWYDDKNRRRRDVWVKNIPELNWRAAIKLMRCRPARPRTEAELERLRSHGFKPQHS